MLRSMLVSADGIVASNFLKHFRLERGEHLRLLRVGHTALASSLLCEVEQTSQRLPVVLLVRDVELSAHAVEERPLPRVERQRNLLLWKFDAALSAAVRREDEAADVAIKRKGAMAATVRVCKACCCNAASSSSPRLPLSARS